MTRMNKASTERYMELTTSTNDMTRKLTDVNSRFDSLHDALKKIDHFNQDIEHLEKKASEIDMLTKQLGRCLNSSFLFVYLTLLKVSMSCLFSDRIYSPSWFRSLSSCDTPRGWVSPVK
ncbi:unnamed protein product [Trichobilharzia regenti]|nr:unnamed protein product [Trichobilharzia regenti]